MLPRIVAVAAMGFQEVVAVCGQRQDALAAVERDEPHQPLVSQVTDVRRAHISGLVASIAQIAFDHHPKRSDGRKRPAVVAVEFVPVIAIHRDLPFDPRLPSLSRCAVGGEHVRIDPAGDLTVNVKIYDYPRHLDVADVIIAVAGPASC